VERIPAAGLYDSAMPYTAEISRQQPACLIFLLDQSGSMQDPFGVGEAPLRKADFLADVVNRTLHDLVIRCTKAEEIRDYFHVAVVGYGRAGGAVASAFTGPLAGRGLVRISAVGQSPARLEDRKKKVPDGAGGLVEQTVRFPVWIDPVHEDGTPMCAALANVKPIVEDWVRTYPAGLPPIVLHITDGESGDGDPTAHGRALIELASKDGAVLLFNCHLSAQRAPKAEFPANGESLPDAFARTLFGISSELPPQFASAAKELGLTIAPGARGFVFNADAAALVHFFDIGTRPANR
jgi:hypothetical protein